VPPIVISVGAIKELLAGKNRPSFSHPNRATGALNI